MRNLGLRRLQTGEGRVMGEDEGKIGLRRNPTMGNDGARGGETSAFLRTGRKEGSPARRRESGRRERDEDDEETTKLLSTPFLVAFSLFSWELS